MAFAVEAGVVLPCRKASQLLSVVFAWQMTLCISMHSSLPKGQNMRNTSRVHISPTVLSFTSVCARRQSTTGRATGFKEKEEEEEEDPDDIWTTLKNKLDAMQKAVAEHKAAAEERMGQGTGKERAERDKEQEAKDMAEEKGGQRSGERSREKVLQEESRSDKRNQQVCRCVSVCLLCV